MFQTSTSSRRLEGLLAARCSGRPGPSRQPPGAYPPAPKRTRKASDERRFLNEGARAEKPSRDAGERTARGHPIRARARERIPVLVEEIVARLLEVRREAGWTAGVTRARLRLGRPIGPYASKVAASRSLADGLGALAGSAYGERVRAGQDLAAAERGAADTPAGTFASSPVASRCRRRAGSGARRLVRAGEH